MQEHLKALNQYYDKVYVLSVAAAAARREKFAKRFQGLQYDFFYGADKNNFSVPDLVTNNIYSETLTRAHHRYNKNMRPGEIACSISHKMMYEDMLRNGYRRILIFEDDAVPDPAMLDKIPAVLEELPADWELLMWGWDKNGTTNWKTGFKQLIYHVQHALAGVKWTHRMIHHLYAKPYSTHLKKAGFHDYTYAYALSAAGAEKLVRLQTPVQYIADNLLAHAATTGLLNAFIAYPPVFLHDNLPDGTHSESYIR
ncbi:MAG: glycosyltransferase family 25 protein [Bacteroidetes bacterium]|nr:glycosyltransferase family 25 protein [Bacteroidota bacterium]